MRSISASLLSHNERVICASLQLELEIIVNVECLAGFTFILLTLLQSLVLSFALADSLRDKGLETKKLLWKSCFAHFEFALNSFASVGDVTNQASANGRSVISIPALSFMRYSVGQRRLKYSVKIVCFHYHVIACWFW